MTEELYLKIDEEMRIHLEEAQAIRKILSEMEAGDPDGRRFAERRSEIAERLGRMVLAKMKDVPF